MDNILRYLRWRFPWLILVFWSGMVFVFLVAAIIGSVALVSCAGIQSNRKISDRKDQRVSTRIEAAEGATVYSLTFQTLKDSRNLTWITAFGLTCVGWARSVWSVRRRDLGGLRLVEGIRVGLDSNVTEIREAAKAIADVVKRHGRGTYGHDHTEKWINALVKKNRRRKSTNS